MDPHNLIMCYLLSEACGCFNVQHLMCLHTATIKLSCLKSNRWPIDGPEREHWIKLCSSNLSMTLFVNFNLRTKEFSLLTIIHITIMKAQMPQDNNWEAFIMHEDNSVTLNLKVMYWNLRNGVRIYCMVPSMMNERKRI